MNAATLYQVRRLINTMPDDFTLTAQLVSQMESHTGTTISFGTVLRAALLEGYCICEVAERTHRLWKPELDSFGKRTNPVFSKIKQIIKIIKE